jgi:hypothetical protein
MRGHAKKIDLDLPPGYPSSCVSVLFSRYMGDTNSARLDSNEASYQAFPLSLHQFDNVFCNLFSDRSWKPKENDSQRFLTMGID